MIETAMGSAQTWECDAMGHLNVQFYVSRASEGLATLGLALGVGGRSSGVSLLATEHHIRYLREIRPGSPLVVWGGVLGVTADQIRVYQEIRNTATDEVAATFTTEAALFETATRARARLPADMTGRARAFHVEQPAHGAPKGLTFAPPRHEPTWEEADRLGLKLTQQGAVSMKECDRHGFFVTRAYMGRIADALPNVIARLRGEDRAADGNLGGAALEYRLIYRSAPREGDVLALRSGLKGLGGKTFNFAHWLIDRESGRTVASAESINVLFDLVRRKAVDLPEAIRQTMTAQITPGMSI